MAGLLGDRVALPFGLLLIGYHGQTEAMPCSATLQSSHGVLRERETARERGREGCKTGEGGSQAHRPPPRLPVFASKWSTSLPRTLLLSLDSTASKQTPRCLSPADESNRLLFVVCRDVVPCGPGEGLRLGLLSPPCPCCQFRVVRTWWLSPQILRCRRLSIYPWPVTTLIKLIKRYRNPTEK